MISSVQLRSNTKQALDKIKEKPSESYEEVILRLIKLTEQQKRSHINLMIEGAKETANESLKITKDFEKIDQNFDWEWEDEN